MPGSITKGRRSEPYHLPAETGKQSCRFIGNHFERTRSAEAGSYRKNWSGHTALHPRAGENTDQLNNEVDKTIKKNLLLYSRQWNGSLSEVALDYIVNQAPERRCTGAAYRSDVWPLYAALDIRNSSVERSQSIKADILEQLNLALDVIKKAETHLNFPLLQELSLRLTSLLPLHPTHCTLKRNEH